MEHGYPLSRLPAIVAAVRARTAPMRLSLRNSERFGVLHLYFSGGRLVAVEAPRRAAQHRPGRPGVGEDGLTPPRGWGAAPPHPPSPPPRGLFRPFSERAGCPRGASPPATGALAVLTAGASLAHAV